MVAAVCSDVGRYIGAQESAPSLRGQVHTRQSKKNAEVCWGQLVLCIVQRELSARGMSDGLLWRGRAGDAAGLADVLGSKLRFRPSIVGSVLRDPMTGKEEEVQRAARERAKSFLHAPGLEGAKEEYEEKESDLQSPNILVVSDIHGLLLYAWRQSDGAFGCLPCVCVCVCV